jgi:trigger factor
MPDLEVKGYTGLSVTRESTEVTEEQITQVINGLLDSNAQLEPVGGGLVGADGKSTARPAKKGDFVDMEFKGGLVTEKGLKELPGMKGTRVVEIGSDSLIPGFEDNLVGMREGETRTFKLKFPAEYHEKELAGQDSEFTATINSIKEKKLPALDDEFAKTMGYESATDLKTKARGHLEQQKKEDSDRKLRSDLLEQVIEKNPFDVPAALIESQTRSLAQDWAQELKQQGISEQIIQNAIGAELANIRKRAENQVRASLILDAISKKEKIELPADAMEAELKRSAAAMQVDEQKLRDFYAKNPARQEDMEFRLRQESTLKFLLDKAKIKSKS